MVREVSKLVGSAPETLNTLEELAQALNNNADIVTVLNNAIATKASIDDLSAYTTNALHEELKAEVDENELVAAQALTKLNNEKANKSDIPTSLSQLTNDSGYVTTEALNAKGYITSVPSEYVTEDVLSGYTTTEQFEELYNGVIDNELVISRALTQLDTDKANVSDIPTNISELNNDKGYLTEIPSEYVTEMNTKISEMQALITSLQGEITALKTELNKTLVVE